jgi:hypothetical protein
VAIAASLAIVAIGVWQGRELSDVVPRAGDLRGPADSIRAVAFVRGRMLVVNWEPSANADRYGVRLQKSDATLILERVVTDTSLVIPRDSLANVIDGERVYWEIRAFDALRRTIARSSLVPIVVPTAAR